MTIIPLVGPPTTVLPLIIQRRREGRFSSTRFHHELVSHRQRFAASCSLSSQTIISNGQVSSSLDVSSQDGRFLLAGRSRGSVALYDLARDDRSLRSTRGGAALAPHAANRSVHSPVAMATGGHSKTITSVSTSLCDMVGWELWNFETAVSLSRQRSLYKGTVVSSG
jgi:hypothetical protein